MPLVLEEIKKFMDGLKKCGKCNEIKSFSDFWKDKSTKTGKSSSCKKCLKHQSKEIYQKNKEEIKLKTNEYYKANKDKIKPRKQKYNQMNTKAAKGRNLKCKFGLSIHEFEQMYAESGGLCSICNKPETTKSSLSDKRRILSVDHDHKTGLVRGLLCNRCNTALGLFRDSLEIIKRADDYLRKHRNKEISKMLIKIMLGGK